MTNLNLEAKSTALVLIDLQNGIAGLPLAPYTAAGVIERSAKLAEALRAKGGTVVYVRVELTDMLRLPMDQPMGDPDAPPPPAIASELVKESGYRAGDVLITKRQWGAFYGTGLEQQLRRRSIRTIVLGGIATNFGVESTGRAGMDRGYQLVFAEDAMSSVSAEAHGFVVQQIFPRMGHVRKTNEVIAGLV